MSLRCIYMHMYTIIHPHCSVAQDIMCEIVRRWKVFVPLLLLVALLYLHWPQKYLHVFEQHYRPSSAPEHRQLFVSSDNSLARDSTSPIANDRLGAEMVFEETEAFSNNHNDPPETEQPHHKGNQFSSEENERPTSSGKCVWS